MGAYVVREALDHADDGIKTGKDWMLNQLVKFKAVNNRDKNFARAKMERRLAQIEESVARYLGQLDTADLQDTAETLSANTQMAVGNFVAPILVYVLELAPRRSFITRGGAIRRPWIQKPRPSLQGWPHAR
jgi:hypothetical protein